MILLFFLLIQPAIGPVRTKISNLEDEIQAYKLLEHKKDGQSEKEPQKNGQNGGENQSPGANPNTEFIPPKKTEKNEKIYKKISIFEIVKLQKDKKLPQFFWNKNTIEIKKN